MAETWTDNEGVEHPISESGPQQCTYFAGGDGTRCNRVATHDLLCLVHVPEEVWEESCSVCGTPTRMTSSRFEVLGSYCDGCFGWPQCPCSRKHTGSCPFPRGPIGILGL